MAKKLNENVAVFVDELKQRVELLSSSKVTENIDNANIDEIDNILKKYNLTSQKELLLDDIKDISLDDIKEILNLTGQNSDSIEYLVSNMNEHLEKILNIINKYINDFISIGKNQSEMIHEKINLYQKYIDLFSKDPIDSPFTELNEMCRVISEVGLNDEEKWKILEYIATSNTNTARDENVELNIRVNQALDSISLYLEDEEKLELIKKYVKDNEIDIDSLYEVGLDLASKLDLSVEITINILCSHLASSLLEQYKASDDSNTKEELEESINLVLSYITRLFDPAVYEALEIKKQTEDFYKNSLANGITEENIKEYLDTPLSLIESEDISREYAIELKELSVLKPIYETLMTIAKLDQDKEEYTKAISILKKLIEQYKLLESKKNDITKRIN